MEQPLSPLEREAFRAYMHDLNRLSAIALGKDPDIICPYCGEDLPHQHTCESGWTGDRCTFHLFHDGPHSNE